MPNQNTSGVWLRWGSRGGIGSCAASTRDMFVQVLKQAGMEVCAVGDGANDELMIREAHCGIGIGMQPTADTRTFSDRQVMRASRVQSSAAP